MSEVNATDTAVAYAEEHDVDLDDVEGTGSGGRILKTDVEQYVAERDGTDDEQDADEGGYYCPGCGKRYDTDAEPCTGPTAESPHPPIDVVSIKELDDDAEHHTPAPNTEPSAS